MQEIFLFVDKYDGVEVKPCSDEMTPEKKNGCK